jgi:hypothetical protein
MNRSEQINELAEALALAQGEMEGAPKDRQNPHFRSSYADLASVWGACRKPLANHGLSVAQVPRVIKGEDPAVEVETLLMHKSGQWISNLLELPVAKADTQGFGSAITYARRYALAAVVGVAPEDDDAEGAVGRGASSQHQQSSGRDEQESAPRANGNGSNGGAKVLRFPYGKCKGRAITDPSVSVADLEWMAARMTEAVRDPSKSQYRADNQRLLEALQIEILRHGRDEAEPKVDRSEAQPPPPGDDDIPF